MKIRLSASEISLVLKKAIQSGQFSNEDSAVIFQDLGFLENRIKHLKQLFPENTLHAIAAKANPLPAILEHIRPIDVGVECATLSEVYLAQKSGYDPKKIVFDSPAKTIEEIKYALKAGIHINADSFEELERINNLLKSNPTKSIIGLRINPQVGSGKISITSVAGTYSKFAIPITEFENELIESYQKYDWLSGIHMHIGSQGCSLDQLLEAAEKLSLLLGKIGDFIKWVDIGGGLPVIYEEGKTAPSMETYATELQKRFPELFDGRYKIITEFGRYIHANAGWTASKVEYVKKSSGVNTAVIHVGADQLMRRAYQPEFWYHDISVADKNGNLKPTTRTENYTVAGPLCFGGDIIARDIELPVINEDDYIIIHDTGAYTLSMWCRHTSRQIPKVVGYQNDGGKFQTLKKRESLEDVYNFWK
ncbi:MAG: diaminopimelate decarboxylase [Calditrichaeota bacterium]|nr:MAG: diaminopimelate decarboxylase [Calditrichota bacterium]MBL1205135.1 diaminopimelate decarboxylase [Calditrichota bacterium]NOG44965.1 diaminopimelate decarboxylase [Calditrichota bacterium]